MSLKARIAPVLSRIQRLKAVRVAMHYSTRRGPLLAGGLSYQAIFAVFAGLWVSFSVAGIIVQNSPGLREALFTVINTSVPGLIDDGNGEGAIKRSALLSTAALGWTGGLSLAGLLFTALAWLASGRDAVRTMFRLETHPVNFFILKAKDFGLAVGFGAILLVSAILSVLSTAALGWVFQVTGVGQQSIAATVAARIIGLLLVFVIDAVTLAAFFRIVADVPIPRPELVNGAILGAIALGALKALGSALLGGATSNPLLAGFAVIVGLLIWFNLVCQVILLAASWISVSLADHGRSIPGQDRVAGPD